MRKAPFFVEFMGTPEAGKTTIIKTVEKKLTNNDYLVSVVRESAEILPAVFQKGSFDAAIWMYLNAIQKINVVIRSNADIVIADRGILDGMFYNMRFAMEDIKLSSTAKAFDEFVKELKIMPDLLINFTTTPEECLKRRGGEGRLVTYDYISLYNQHLELFHNTIEVPKIRIDTTGVSINAITNEVLDYIFNGIC